MFRNLKLLEGRVLDPPFSVEVLIGALRVVLLHGRLAVFRHQLLVQIHRLLKTIEKVLFFVFRLRDLLELLSFAGLQ